MKRPVVDLSECILCGVCEDICPKVFRLNDAGFIEVIEQIDYSEADIADAIKNCPTDCIYWEED
jgi:ferredoxin